MATDTIAAKITAEVTAALERNFPDRARRRAEAAQQEALRQEARQRWDAEVHPRRELARRYLEVGPRLRAATVEAAKLAREMAAIVGDDSDRAAAQRRARDIGGLHDAADVAALPAILQADAFDHFVRQIDEAAEVATKFRVAKR